MKQLQVKFNKHGKSAETCFVLLACLRSFGTDFLQAQGELAQLPGITRHVAFAT